ncbi:TolC family protein [Thioalbus denitrificans]|uniref:Outer membrane protein TolC n=1 Tax=Thioalbus denitrificans TaxID=547122 RepID=A0A369CDK5_9GAMM|nr:TolC family protein [Thioalbus denitrificans]RCX32122.1 outer membrane protein TolC [Thioalbus denitrificans]
MARKVRFAALLVLGLALPLPGSAATTVALTLDTGRLTLDQAIQWALVENPNLSGLHRDLQAEALEREVARGKRMPELTLEGDYTHHSEPTLTHSIHDPGSFPPLDEDTASLGVGLTLPLYAGGRLVAGERRAEHGLQAKSQALAGSRQQLIFDVVTAYTAALQHSEVVTALEHRIRGLEAEDADLALKIKQGTAAPLERMRIQSQISEARYDLATERQSAGDARDQLARLLGSTDPLPPLADIRGLELPLPEDRDAALAQALAGHPDLQRSRAEQLTALDDLHIARGERLPEVRLQARLNGNSGGDLELEDEWQMGVNISVPLFDGAVRSTRVRQAALRRERAQLGIQSSRDAVTLGVRESWGGLTTRRAQLEAAQAGEREAGEALRVETFKFRNGASTVTDLLAAEAALWSATASRIEAEYSIVVEQARLLLAVGHLESDRFGGTRP